MFGELVLAVTDRIVVHIVLFLDKLVAFPHLDILYYPFVKRPLKVKGFRGLSDAIIFQV